MDNLVFQINIDKYWFFSSIQSSTFFDCLESISPSSPHNSQTMASKPKTKPLNQEQIIAGLNQLRQEQRYFSSKISELEADISEHKYATDRMISTQLTKTCSLISTSHSGWWSRLWKRLTIRNANVTEWLAEFWSNGLWPKYLYRWKRIAKWWAN